MLLDGSGNMKDSENTRKGVFNKKNVFIAVALLGTALILKNCPWDPRCSPWDPRCKCENTMEKTHAPE